MLRLLVTPRWLGWTLLAAVSAGVCGAMSWWQLGRAESATGSLLNAGYAFQWPLFGLFFLALWWRMLRAEARQLAELRAGDDPPGDPLAGPPTDLVGTGVALLTGPSPFTPRPRGTEMGLGQGAAAPGSARAEYNAYLAELARHREAAPPSPPPATARQEPRP